MRRIYVCYIIACVIAMWTPFLAPLFEAPVTSSETARFPGWSSTFAGKPLTQLPLNEMEKTFASGFPGRIMRFTDGEREIIVRWVTEATRMLHPSSDCFQGLGYTVKPLPAHRDQDGSLWASFAATKGEERLLVKERIISDDGEAWTDVSAWYWSALRHEGSGSWWAITVAEKQR
jgi:hypothetical protein